MRVELPLRHRDLDSLGHVNQAVYHELLEEVRAAFFREALPDLPFTGYVLVHAALDYRAEVRIAHRYLIGEAHVAELGRSRVRPGQPAGGHRATDSGIVLRPARTGQRGAAQSSSRARVTVGRPAARST